jgi:hypothetical protein
MQMSTRNRKRKFWGSRLWPLREAELTAICELNVTYLNIIEEEMCVSEVEDHLLHPEPQLHHGLRILKGAQRTAA